MSTGDPGLFGPGSLTWRVHADPTMAVSGLRALFLQALHPRAVAGLAQHSDVRADPWGRLLRTAGFVGITSFGTRQEAERAAARVRDIHRRYRLDEPDLLLWVHCVEVESFLSTAVRAGLRMSRAERDRYYSEQRRSAALVGLDPLGVPASAAEMAAYFTAVRPQLALTPNAREAATLVLWPPMPARVALGTPARPAWTLLAGTAFALLPRWARRLYGLPGLPSTDLAATAAVAALRSGLLVVPEGLRQGPHVRRARARLG